jgi:hypothetical protein
MWEFRNRNVFVVAAFSPRPGMVNGHQVRELFPAGKPLLALKERACRYR